MPTFTSLNPATGRRLSVFRGHTPTEVERALARVTVAQRAWAMEPLRVRAFRIRALGRHFRAHADALAAQITAEMGKPITQARAEVEKSATLCDYYSRHSAQLLAAERPLVAPDNARVVYEPLGTVLSIMPWNFPVWQVARAAVPALLAGNAFILKHASNVSGCAHALEKLFVAAGFSRALFQSLRLDNQGVAKLIGDPRIHAVTLTGSTGAGKQVAALAGAAMKPGVFELGGSDPALILADADIEHAAEACVQSRLLNSGQSCVCAKRFIVVRDVLKKFEAAFTSRMAAAVVGDPTLPITAVGPLARADLRTELHAQVQRSLAAGARLLLGGAPVPGKGYFYAPTILANVRPGMPAFDEELFGPVAAIIPAANTAIAIELANRSRYGLGASVYTRSRATGQRVARALEAGSVYINDFVRSAPELPFGGIKESGYGRELGAWGARSFTNVKTISTR